jgi:hypothetical protein
LTSGVLGQFGACLSFYYDLLINDHIDALYAKLLSFVRDSSPYFARHSMATRQKLSLQRHHVAVLEKSESEVVVNLEKRPITDRASVSSSKPERAMFQNCASIQTPNHQTPPRGYQSPPGPIRPIRSIRQIRITLILDASGALLLYF